MAKNSQPLPELPEALNTPEFRQVWDMWLDYRRQHKKKPVSAYAARVLLPKLERVGVRRAILALEQSIANDWQGVFPEKVMDLPLPPLSRGVLQVGGSVSRGEGDEEDLTPEQQTSNIRKLNQLIRESFQHRRL